MCACGWRVCSGVCLWVEAVYKCVLVARDCVYVCNCGWRLYTSICLCLEVVHRCVPLAWGCVQVSLCGWKLSTHVCLCLMWLCTGMCLWLEALCIQVYGWGHLQYVTASFYWLEGSQAWITSLSGKVPSCAATPNLRFWEVLSSTEAGVQISSFVEEALKMVWACAVSPSDEHCNGALWESQDSKEASKANKDSPKIFFQLRYPPNSCMLCFLIIECLTIFLISQ